MLKSLRKSKTAKLNKTQSEDLNIEKSSAFVDLTEERQRPLPLKALNLMFIKDYEDEKGDDDSFKEDQDNEEDEGDSPSI